LNIERNWKYEKFDYAERGDYVSVNFKAAIKIINELMEFEKQ
jgi:hypothetical protein